MNCLSPIYYNLVFVFANGSCHFFNNRAWIFVTRIFVGKDDVVTVFVSNLGFGKMQDESANRRTPLRFPELIIRNARNWPK